MLFNLSEIAECFQCCAMSGIMGRERERKRDRERGRESEAVASSVSLYERANSSLGILTKVAVGYSAFYTKNFVCTYTYIHA